MKRRKMLARRKKHLQPKIWKLTVSQRKRLLLSLANGLKASCLVLVCMVSKFVLVVTLRFNKFTAYKHYRTNPEELEKAVEERRTAVASKEVGNSIWDAAVQNVEADFKTLTKKYTKLNLSQSKHGQCLQNYYCARIGEIITEKLDSEETPKDKRAAEKKIRSQLNGM